MSATMRTRVFQIGFNRCGTMSLARLFAASGLRAAHWRGGTLAAWIELARREGKPLLSYVDRYDLYTDMEARDLGEIARRWFPRRPFRRLLATPDPDRGLAPIFAFRYFAELDRQYPGSKFILNTRDRERWIRSRLDFKANYRACQHGDRAHEDLDDLRACWRTDWDTHHERVRTYFAERPSQLLVFDIETDPIDAVVRFMAPTLIDPRHWQRHNASTR